MRRAVCLLNFFPLGFNSGPMNDSIAKVPFHALTRRKPEPKAALHYPKETPPMPTVARGLLKMQCMHCRFGWDHDRLHVWCPADESHNQREHAWPATFTWGPGYQPYQLFKYTKRGYHDQSGNVIGNAMSIKNSNERRACGLSTVALHTKKERMKLSQESGINHGFYGKRWKTHFPYPV